MNHVPVYLVRTVLVRECSSWAPLLQVLKCVGLVEAGFETSV